MKRYIKASLHKLESDNIILTDYAGDIVNLLLNKPKCYRIVYVPSDIYGSSKNDGDIYLIGDAIQFLHEDLLEIAVYEGWFPYLSQDMKKFHEDVGYLDMYRTMNYVFLTNDEIDEAYSNPYGKYAFAEYNYEYKLPTGSIFTKWKNFEIRDPDLYQAFSKYFEEVPE